MTNSMRRFNFKMLWQQATAAVFLLALLIIAACGEDEPKVDPVTVQFNASNLGTITEDGGAKSVTLTLSSAAKKDGTISLSATPANANTFATFPAEIVITKGSTSAQFLLTPLNNGDIDAAAKVITLTLEDPSSGFELGEKTTHTITITDDEGPTTANFTATSGTVAENAAAGIVVSITLSPAAEVAGSIEVTMTPADAAVTTTPAAATGIITVPVTVGQTSVSFTVIPTNNTADGADLEIAFEITDAIDGVLVGTNVDYTLTVDDDDDIVPVPIADVKAMYSSADVVLTTDLYIRAIVTSVSGATANTNPSGAYVQEETGGAILLFFTGSHNFTRGDVVLVNLKGGTITNFGGLLEVTGIPAANATNAKVGTDDLPAYTTVTVAEFLAADRTSPLQSKLVKIENVSFPLADGILTMNGTRTFTDGANSGIAFTRSAASFSSSLLPLGSGTIQGILSNNTNVVQLLPQVFTEDIFANTPVGTIGTAGTLADFGSINNGASSAEQSYDVQGMTLTNDIVITASAGYSLSSTSGGTFGPTLTIPAASANSATEVFVKFSPATGSDQVIAGTLTHKSQGAATVVVNVTGTETGNGASALQTLAHWTFETTAPVLNNSMAITNLLAELGLQANVAVASGFHASADTDYSSPAGNGSSKSFSSNTWAVGDYYQFVVSTTGFSDIAVSWDQTGSSTGPGDFALEYSTDGTNFTSLPNYSIVKSVTPNIIYEDATTGAGWMTNKRATNTSLTYDLSTITTLNGLTSVTFRITCKTAPSAAGGTGRLDNVKVEGRP